jgi:hypothetical protein
VEKTARYKTNINSTPVLGGMIRPRLLQRACACGKHAGSGGECAECKHKREATLQRSAADASQISDVPPIMHEVLHSPGQPLDIPTRSFMEPRFGYDFSQVKVYAGAQTAPGAKTVADRSTGQAGLSVSQPGDKYEQEADRVADLIATLPTAPSAVGQQIYKQAGDDHDHHTPGIDAHFEVLKGKGQPLSASVRALLEPRFQHDFSHVRVFTDPAAATLASVLNARAFTFGSDMVFGRSEYSPMTISGQHLLAHELTHTIQQAEYSNISLQRVEIPSELLTSADVTSLSDDELQQRYDLITATLTQFDSSSSDTEPLETEAGRIGVELGRRRALATGRTFSGEAIERMRQYFMRNAKSNNPANCIDTLDRGIKLLFNDPAQPVGMGVDTTMAKLITAGRSDAGRVIEFESVDGNITYGTLYPNNLHESVWDTVISLAGGDPGWSVFGLSIMDGFHSVTLTLDNSDPSNPHVYWSDQWSDKGGWKEYDRSGLDAEITKWTQTWWNGRPQGRKPKTRTTLWRLKTTPAAAAPGP